MWSHNCVMRVDFSAAFPQVVDQFFARLQLAPGRLIAVKISDQTNTQSDVVQIIAVNVAAVNLPAPAVANLDLPVSGRCAVAYDEMICQAVLHPSHVPMVIIENASTTLTRSAVMHDNKLPAAPHHRSAIDFISD